MERLNSLPVWKVESGVAGNGVLSSGYPRHQRDALHRTKPLHHRRSRILYSGKETHHTHEVGINYHEQHSSDALIGWKLVIERFITARFHTRHAKVAVVQVYAPTEGNSENDKTQLVLRLSFRKCLTKYRVMT